MKFFKSVLVAFFVLILSAGIFFLLVKDQKIKDDILRSTLQLFGDDLMAMVPNGEQKELLKRKYDDFLHKADNEKLPPEEIERVAAAILNLTTQDTIVQAEEALTALNLNNEDLIYPPKVPFLKSFPLRERSSTGKSAIRRPPRPQPYDWNDQERRAIAARLNKVKEFHEDMHGFMQHDSNLKALRKQVFFNADSGLTVALNIDFKNFIDFDKDTTLQNQIKKLEKENILVWKATKAQQAEMEKALNMVLGQIPQISINMQNIGQILHNAGVLDSAHLNIDQYLNADSLQKMIEKKIREGENINSNNLPN